MDIITMDNIPIEIFHHVAEFCYHCDAVSLALIDKTRFKNLFEPVNYKKFVQHCTARQYYFICGEVSERHNLKDSLCFISIEYGNIDFYIWAMGDYICRWSGNHTLCAAKHGHLNIIEWIIDNKTRGKKRLYDIHILYEAVKYGHLHIVEWIINKYSAKVVDNFSILMALKHKQTNILELFIKYGINATYIKRHMMNM